MGRGCVTREEPSWPRPSFLCVPVWPLHVGRTPVTLPPTAGLRRQETGGLGNRVLTGWRCRCARDWGALSSLNPPEWVGTWREALALRQVTVLGLPSTCRKQESEFRLRYPWSRPREAREQQELDLDCSSDLGFVYSTDWLRTHTVPPAGDVTVMGNVTKLVPTLGALRLVGHFRVTVPSPGPGSGRSAEGAP